jgi:hypothetical protein
MPMVWIYRGQWPVHQRLQDLPLEDAMRAESEGWGHRIEGMDGRDVVDVTPGPHDKADAYFSRMIGRRDTPPIEPPPEGAEPPTPPPSGGAYGTREMRAVETPRRGPGRPRKEDPPWPQR